LHTKQLLKITLLNIREATHAVAFVFVILV